MVTILFLGGLHRLSYKPVEVVLEPHFDGVKVGGICNDSTICWILSEVHRTRERCCDIC